MNFVRTKRRLIHVLLLASIFVSFVTPVYAVAAELTSSEPTHVLPVTKPLALSAPPIQVASSEKMGPEKPAEVTPKTPTLTPTSSPTKAPITPSSTSTPTPTPTLTPPATTQPAQAVQAGSNTSNGGLNADILFNMSNTYRAGKGLAPFQTEARICSLAAARAPEIAAEIAGGYMHAGKDSHNFPYRFTENIITMRTEAEAFNWWVNDYIHRVQIEENNTHSCVACSGNACVQHFTSFRPK